MTYVQPAGSTSSLSILRTSTLFYLVPMQALLQALSCYLARYSMALLLLWWGTVLIELRLGSARGNHGTYLDYSLLLSVSSSFSRIVLCVRMIPVPLSRSFITPFSPAFSISAGLLSRFLIWPWCPK